MPELKIQFGDKRHEAGSIKLNKFRLALDSNADAAFREIGVLFTRDIKKRLSGQSHTRFPGNGNPYPGVLTGRLRRSVFYKKLTSFGEWGVEIGPNVEYAAIHEFGGNAGRGGSAKIPARPYMQPSFEDNKAEALNILKRYIFEPLQ